MKYKFEVGDKVRILDGSNITGYTGSWATKMKQYVGKEYKVVKRDGSYRPAYRLSCGCYLWDERGLELTSAKKNKPRIVVYIDKEDPSIVSAKDTETGRVARAKCSPEDTFDFYTGANLAMKRLLDQTPFPVEQKHRTLNVGDYVIGNENNDYFYTKKDTIWKVDSVDGNNITISSPNSHTKYPVLARRFDRYTGPLFTGDMVCVEADGPTYTQGKIYHVKEGGIEGEVLNGGYITSVEALNAEYKDRYKFLEIVKE